MAVLVPHHRLLFLLAPHTASSAIAFLLRESLGGEWIPAEDVRDDKGRVVVPRKHTTLPELIKGALVTEEQRAQLLVFIAVRNPFDMLVSLYLKNAEKDQRLLDREDAWFKGGQRRKEDDLEFCRDHTFAEWIEHVYAPDWRRRLMGRRPNRLRRWEGADIVMRYERLQDDFDAVLERAGVDGAHPIPQRNVTPQREGRDYREFYTPRTRRLVADAYADVLGRFDYSF